MGQYRHHVFVCTSGKTCPLDGSLHVHAVLKKLVAQAGLKGKVRINHSGCMNQCGHGPMVVVYPDDIWYAHVDEDGATRIVEDHLIGGGVVEEYRYVAPPGDNKIVEGDTAP
ncbi:MAG TPA: (2Fe-2S) ferredoxin domain-containing protein [Gemmatimonadaceae bacterium]|nr:(2Fe-2S) ferredoxin domain-containing protein [Gemmatimonadaceae bacterium]